MSPPEPSPGDADTALTVSRNHVVVTGAGFTRALVPGAPLLVDDFSNDVLEARVRGLPNASRPISRVSMNRPVVAMRGSRPLCSRADG